MRFTAKKIANDAENVVGALQQAKRNELQDDRAPGRRSDKTRVADSRRHKVLKTSVSKAVELVYSI